jgi:hypothetical protein
METTEFCLLNAADRDRIRQKVLLALIRLGYDEGSMRLDESLVLDTEEGELRVPIEILVSLNRDPILLVKCVRGNLGTRERASVALARLLKDRPIPFAIVANESDAVVFDTITGQAVGHGYGAFPAPEEASERIPKARAFVIPSDRREKEKRILRTYYHLRCSAELEPF